LYVLDRNTGQPLHNATVKFYRNAYDYATRTYKRADLGSAVSDANGYVSKDVETRVGNYYTQAFQFDIYYKDDFLPSEQSYYRYNYPEPPAAAQKQVHLFTDRSIYRPGQTIYFKGILTQKTGDQTSMLPDQKIKVTFKDAKYQDIKVAEFITNAYGSFTGTFTAPVTGLMGSMQLTTEYGSQAVQVEEYKRPKFEVTFDPVKKSYNLGDTIRVGGKAVSYSGAALDNVEVRYSVRRVAEFPIWMWWGWKRPWFPATPEKIIGAGAIRTNEDGSFTVDFAAVPDLSVSKSLKPYFTYEVTADVVDINGETHTAVTTVKVGYLAIDAALKVEESMDYTKENKIEVTTRNLNGEPEAADVSVNIYALASPAVPKKKRAWEKPDQFLLTKAEHDKFFPYDVYGQEDNMENWQKEKLVQAYTFNTGRRTELILPAGMLKQGAYLIEFSCNDKNGNPIAFKKTFLANSKDDRIPDPETFSFFQIGSSSVKPGEMLAYRVGSSMPDAYAIVEIGFKGKVLEKKYISLKNEIQSFTFPVKAEYKGGIEMNYVLVNKNRIYADDKFIKVPDDDKSLVVEWITFRDKLLPGQTEQWKLKISGPKKEKVAAEMVASLYDASLDAFLPHIWNFNIGIPEYNGLLGNFASQSFSAKTGNLYTSKEWNKYMEYASHQYSDLNLFGLNFGGYDRRILYKSTVVAAQRMEALSDASAESANAVPQAAGSPPVKEEKPLDQKPKPATPPLVPRTNLNETAFFFPQLETDSSGNILLNFTMPEALTRWNFMALAHTADLHYQYFTNTVVTQKDLMVTPNAPRFLREGDKLQFSAKVSNLSGQRMVGLANLSIYDAATMKDISWKFVEAIQGTVGSFGDREFTADSGKSTVVTWSIRVPQGMEAITYKVTAHADNFSDGEQASLIVLPNRMLVTETLPLWVRGGDKKSYTFQKLLEQKSSTLSNYRLTLEMSSQPVWYAVQALPYLMEYPYECSEQLFSRYYANTLAAYIANQNPSLKAMYEKWKNTDALLSNLEKNETLKAALLEETPWVREAQNESEQKKRISLLFDFARMATEQQKALEKLLALQTPNGGFSWFPGMRDNRYITQYIVAGFGHLAKLGVLDIGKNEKIRSMLEEAVAYMDDRLREDLEEIKKGDKDYTSKNHLWYNSIHALYARSFFDYPVSAENKEAYDYFLSQEKQYWLQQDLYAKGMMALTLVRNGDKQTAGKIVVALKQNAINSEELGMYWKANEAAGWYWYQAPVEIQALLIEAFHEVTNDATSVDELKVWLLKQKQTTAWKSTKATAEACYALLLQGKDWLKSDDFVEATVGDLKIDPAAKNAAIEPGTGYYKVSWSGNEIIPSMAKIQLHKKDKGPAWGAMYWQYFEDLDQITGASTSLQLTKKLFKEINTDEGKKLAAVSDSAPFQIGDVVKVRIELRTDRNLEYIHMKDMRAAGFEPVNVLSSYKFQDGLGYYESTKDVATHFFMDWLPKGVYVFEYAMRATIAGNFSNGITEIESMYAPEFKSHSQGDRVLISAQP
jgi:5-hydroxyisourate hydrolase-like protein (transthyretin family)